MPPKLRLEYPGAIYHVMSRGPARGHLRGLNRPRSEGRSVFARERSERAGLARAAWPAYALRAVEQPLVNLEEKIDRFVGRRTKTASALSTKTSSKVDSIAWRAALGGIRVPRGVYRFKTHEEADQWLWRMIARPRN